MEVDSKVVRLSNMLHNAMDIDFELFDKNLNLLYRAITNPYPDGIAYNLEAYYQDIKKHLGQSEKIAICYHHIDNLAFLFTECRILFEEEIYYIIIGPFLTVTLSDSMIHGILQKNGMSMSLFQQYRNYYAKVRYFTDTTKDIIDTVLCVFLGELYQKDEISVQTIRHGICMNMSSNMAMQGKLKKNEENILKSDNYRIINNYTQERKWREAIKNGDFSTARKAFNSMSSGEFLERTQGDPLRAQKNLLIVVNTLGRAAASDAGVDFIRIHQTSDFFAHSIEQAKDALEVSKLWEDIIEGYCKLSVSATIKTDNSLVTETIQYLYAYYQTPLTLESVADAILVSPSHLSRTFKKETGITFGRYLTQIRLKQAIHLLQYSKEIPVTDIALIVGFSSYTRFSIALKEETGRTAREIRNQNIGV